MKIRDTYRQSRFNKFISLLFSPNEFNKLSESKLYMCLNKLDYPKISYILVCLSLGLIFFEGFLLTKSIDIGLIPSSMLIVSLIFCDKKKLIINKSIIWLYCILLVAIISGFFGIFNGTSPLFIILGLLIVIQFLVSVVLGSTFNFYKLSITLLILGFPVAIIGIYQYFFKVQTPVLWVSAQEGMITTRAFGFFGSPNVFGILMLILSVISFGLLIRNKKWYLGGGLLIYLVALLFSLSRTAFIGFLASTIVFTLLYNWKYLGIFFFAPAILFFNNIRLRIINLFSYSYYVDSLLDGRLWALKNGLYIFRKHIIFGTGPGSYGGQIAVTQNSPIYLSGLQNGYVALYFTDNQWFEILIQCGILGALIVLGFFVSLYWQLLQNYSKSRNVLVATAISVLSGIIICGFSANVLEFSAIAIPSGLIIGSALNEK